ncbi:bactofilin family protein [Paenibacillus alkalitolerans]|uniref:bactofilin family protein n=1 Tax=Paenibacillus alkalitolerans TaxID=2799335 RepID=UPI0018F2B882|nr:polymer-forming cytoskeletal protein [Paenibacillus alkalitolerans]
MFKGKRIDVSATDTLIGEGSVFEGKVKSEASIRIEGRLIGDIECEGDVTIGEAGNAKSNITARNVVIAGVVHGSVTTKGTLTITATGQLYGNTTAQTLVIAEGAVFQGTSKMEGKQGAGKEAKPEPEKSSSGSQSYGSVAM